MNNNQRELFIMFLMCELGCLDRYLNNAKSPQLRLVGDFCWMATKEGYHYWIYMDSLIDKELEYYISIHIKLAIDNMKAIKKN